MILWLVWEEENPEQVAQRCGCTTAITYFSIDFYPRRKHESFEIKHKPSYKCTFMLHFESVRMTGSGWLLWFVVLFFWDQMCPLFPLKPLQLAEHTEHVAEVYICLVATLLLFCNKARSHGGTQGTVLLQHVGDIVDTVTWWKKLSPTFSYARLGFFPPLSSGKYVINQLKVVEGLAWILPWTAMSSSFLYFIKKEQW